MITSKEMEKHISFIDEFQKNVIRSMNIRIKIAQNRAGAIRLLELNRQDSRGIELLERCVKNERWFLRLMKEGLSNSQVRLSEVYAWIEQNVQDKKLKQNAARLIGIVDLFNLKLPEIETRLNLEEQFLENLDDASYRAFVEQWKNETKLTRILLKKIVDTSDLASYFKQMNVIFKKSLVAAASSGIAAGALYATLKANPEITLTGMLVSAFCCTLALVLTNLGEVEKTVEQLNTKALASLK